MVIVLNVNHTDYRMLLKDAASLLKIPYNNSHVLPVLKSAGNGYMKAFNLFGELQVLLIDASFSMDIVTKRTKDKERYYVLHFDDLSITKPFKFEVEGDQLVKTDTRYAVARLTSNIFTNTEMIPSGQHLKTVKVLLTENWMRQHLGLDGFGEVHHQYLDLKTASFDMEPLDNEYLSMLDELWGISEKEPLFELILQNRITLLIERFFSRIYDKVNAVAKKYHLTEDEMHRLILVEKDIISKLGVSHPTIDQCAKLASMSTTKLKKSFKDLFGDSIYSYYQKHRMQKAKELIATGRFTLKQVAQAVGYDSISNFTIAYKKQFHKKPTIIVDKEPSAKT